MAKGRNLKVRAVDDDENYPELRTHRNSTRENALHILGPSASRDVIILWLFVQQHIAHAAAGKKTFIACSTQLLNDRVCLGACRHCHTIRAIQRLYKCCEPADLNGGPPVSG